MGKKKKAEFTDDDDALLAELGVEAKAEKASTYTPRQERIIAGFEEIQRFVEEHRRIPQHGEDRDIFERLYAVRLDRIRQQSECVELLKSMDRQGLLNESADPTLATLDSASDDELLEALGVEGVGAEESSVAKLTHVRPRAEINAAEEVAQRIPCKDFDLYKPIFEKVQQELTAGTRKTGKHQEIFNPAIGDMYIVHGQKALIAERKEKFTNEHNRMDRRLRVIYDNGTESNLLLRSLQRALIGDPAGRQILPPDNKGLPLFADQIDEEDAQSGYVYVARSLSKHPFIAEHRELIHKIGVTGQDVKKRIAGAKKDPTFLLADVELVESYKLANINRVKLEQLLHRFFADARIDLELNDRFDEKVEPREWFLVPLQSVRTAIEMMKSGDIEQCRYDRASAAIVDRKTGQPLESPT